MFITSWLKYVSTIYVSVIIIVLALFVNIVLASLLSAWEWG